MARTNETFESMGRIAALVFAASFVLTGCLSMPTDPQTEQDSRVAIGLHLGAVEPGAGARLERVVVSLEAPTGERILDTITAHGSVASLASVFLDPDAEKAQLLHPLYSLPAGRGWNVTVTSHDAHDSILHAQTFRIAALEQGAFRDHQVRMAPRFARYEARFALPSHLSDPAGRTVLFDRVVLEVDGAVVRDSVAGPGSSFLSGGNGESVSLGYSYLAAGTRQVAFKAYGRFEGEQASQSRLLYQGGTGMEVSLGRSAPDEAVTLEWTGPEDGVAETETVGMQVTFGKVHTNVINVVIPGAVVL